MPAEKIFPFRGRAVEFVEFITLSWKGNVECRVPGFRISFSRKGNVQTRQHKRSYALPFLENGMSKHVTDCLGTSSHYVFLKRECQVPGSRISFSRKGNVQTRQHKRSYALPFLENGMSKTCHCRHFIALRFLEKGMSSTGISHFVFKKRECSQPKRKWAFHFLKSGMQAVKCALRFLKSGMPYMPSLCQVGP
jgi:hypothetical protein